MYRSKEILEGTVKWQVKRRRMHSWDLDKLHHPAGGMVEPSLLKTIKHVL